jgi:hypothetical protein
MFRAYCREVIDGANLWKDELARIADRLEAKTKQTRWTQRTDFLIERDFMTAAYAMRKLIESQSVSAEHRLRRIPVRRHDGRRGSLTALELCDEILHSVEFTCFCGETADLFDGVYVVFDLVLASDFIALCADIADSSRRPSDAPLEQ